MSYFNRDDLTIVYRCNYRDGNVGIDNMNLHIRVFPAEDLPYVWVSQCLDLNVISQGENPVHALDMLIEAIEMTIEDCVREGRDPFSRDQHTPQEDFDAFESVLKDNLRPYHE